MSPNLQNSTKRLRFSSMARSMTDGDFEDVGGSVFRSGAASSSRREEGPQTFPTVAIVDAPPLAPRAPYVDLPWALVPSQTLALQDIGIGSAQHPGTGSVCKRGHAPIAKAVVCNANVQQM